MNATDTTPRPTPFAGMRILVVEDHFLLAASLERMLTRLGCEVIGPARSESEARRLIADDGIDIALLNFRLDEGTSAEFARSLLERGRPVAFITAWQRSDLPEDLQDCPLLRKPFSETDLREVLADVIQ